MSIAMAFQGFQQIATGVSDYYIQSQQAKMQEAAREHANVMRGIAAGQEQNAVSRQKVALRDATQRVAAEQKIAHLQDRGSAEVAAAAAGVAGGSVDQVMRQIERNALKAQSDRKTSYNNQNAALDQETVNIELRRITGEDISVIQKPNPALTLLGLGTSLINTYDANQPAGSRSTDALAELFKG